MIKINQVFTQKELDLLNNSVNNALLEDDFNLGRQKAKLDVSDKIKQNIQEIIIKNYSKVLSISSVSYVEYNKKFGEPKLPPHFDHDNTNLIVNFQLSSNVNWPVGLDMQMHDLEDNSALIFSPNEVIHWRPHKIFNDGEYVKMIFFRLVDIDNIVDYSHADYSMDDPIFIDVNAFRDSLNT